MMRFTTLIKHPADWMTGGQEEHGAVLTSRIRFARNLRRHPFPGWATRDQRAAALEMMRPAVEALPAMKDAFSQELCDLSSVQKQVLVERHLISREHAARSDGSAAVIERRQSFSLMLNEEDHLRMQAIRPGLQLAAAYASLSELDAGLETQLEFAFDPTLGYLTTCPTNLGTGLRASAMLHLPALVLSDQIGQVLQAVNKIGLAVRGLYGEGTESLGNLYQISNQSTLGESEETIIRRLERVISQVALHERNARAKLLEDDPSMVADKIGRAYGVLRHAHIIDSKEALNHLSLLRLGGNL
jgi:protein arginine kinase